jgi:hypothetical protein
LECPAGSCQRSGGSISRWASRAGTGGFALCETDNPVALYTGAAKWADVLEFHSSVVIEDADAGPVLAEVFGK